MHMSNNTNYTYKGTREINGQKFGVHGWSCLDCPWQIEKVGGPKEMNAGTREANKHQCYDSSKDSWSNRRDLQ